MKTSDRCSTCRLEVIAVGCSLIFISNALAKVEPPGQPRIRTMTNSVLLTPRGGGGCDGDANEDNVVDPLDSGFVLSRFGCPVGTGDPNCDAADQNQDGVVDPLDVGYVLSRFGPCPEPTLPDDCADAQVIACGDTVTVDNTGASTAVDDPAYSCHFGGPEQGVNTLWYSFVAESEFATVDTCDSAIADTLIAIYDGDCGNPVELACGEDECGASGFLSQATATGLTIGNTYLVQLASWDEGSIGSMTMNLSCDAPATGACCNGGTECADGMTAIECQSTGGAYQGDGTTCGTEGICQSPVNDDCANAIEIFDGVTAFDTSDATDDGPADCTADTGHQDIWFHYTITGAEPGALRISLCDGTDYDSTLSAYSGTSCVGTVLGCSDDDCGIGGGPSELIVNLGPSGDAQVGDTITIRVGGWNDLGGLADPSGTGQITIDYATGGDCCVVHDTPGCDFIDVPDTDPAEVEACVCAIDSFCCDVTWDEACVFIVENNCGVECPLCPSVGTNDECVCAEPIECDGTYTVDISDFFGGTGGGEFVSTCETTEPPCESGGGGPFSKDASWWYMITTGPEQTSLHLSYCSTPNEPDRHDVVMTVFTADSTCDNLVQLDCDDDFCSCPAFGPPETCTAVEPNTTYLILVDHYSGVCGPDQEGCFYTLEVGCDDGCVP